MIRQVIRFRRFRQERGALFEIDANTKRSRFGRFVDGHAGEKLAMHLEGKRPMHGAILHVRQREGNFTNRIEGDFRSRHALLAANCYFPTKC